MNITETEKSFKAIFETKDGRSFYAMREKTPGYTVELFTLDILALDTPLIV